MNYTKRVMIFLLSLGMSSAAYADGCKIGGSGAGLEEIKVTSPKGLFEFHIDPMVSLHHFSYHYARSLSRQKLRSRVPMTLSDKLLVEVGFQKQVPVMVEAYKSYFDKNLLFDPSLSDLRKHIQKGVDHVEDANIANYLREAAPSFGKTIWPAHCMNSAQLLQQYLPLLEKHEQEIGDRISSFMGTHFPDTPIRVDLVKYSNRAGAYTDQDPNNIVISSSDTTMSDGHFFEILYHEALHTSPLGTSFRELAEAVLKKHNIQNDRFWHYALFY